MLTRESSRWWDFAQATESFLSPSPSVLVVFQWDEYKKNCQLNSVTESNSTGFVLKAYKSGKNDAKCVIVWMVCVHMSVRFMLIWSHRQKMQTLRFHSPHFYCAAFCVCFFGGCAQINLSNKQILSHIKSPIEWNTYSSNMPICLLCTVCTEHWSQHIVQHNILVKNISANPSIAL